MITMITCGYNYGHDVISPGCSNFHIFPYLGRENIEIDSRKKNLADYLFLFFYMN